MAQSQYFKTLGIVQQFAETKKINIQQLKKLKIEVGGVPGGRVEPPEDFIIGALREMKEEGGIDVELKGILRFEYLHQQENYLRLKIVFYAEPIDPDVIPDKKSDEHSEEAKWASIDEILELKNSDPGWRGPELYQWANYLEQGGVIFPLDMFMQEGTKPILIQNTDIISNVKNINYEQCKK